jgi:hypothetical protein
MWTLGIVRLQKDGPFVICEQFESVTVEMLEDGWVAHAFAESGKMVAEYERYPEAMIEIERDGTIRLHDGKSTIPEPPEGYTEWGTWELRPI